MTFTTDRKCLYCKHFAHQHGQYGCLANVGTGTHSRGRVACNCTYSLADLARKAEGIPS